MILHLHLYCANLALCYYRSKPPLWNLRNRPAMWSVLHPDVHWGPLSLISHVQWQMLLIAYPIPSPLFFFTKQYPWFYVKWQCALSAKRLLSQGSLQPRVVSENQAASPVHRWGFQESSLKRPLFALLPSWTEHKCNGWSSSSYLGSWDNFEDKSHGLKMMEHKDRKSLGPWWLWCFHTNHGVRTSNFF